MLHAGRFGFPDNMNIHDTEYRAQNNGRSTDNFRPEWQRDWPKTSLAGHVDRSFILSFLNKQPNPHLSVLDFCLFVKIQVEFCTKISELLCPIFWPVRNETWPSKNFFGWSSCPVTIRKLFWALHWSFLFHRLKACERFFKKLELKTLWLNQNLEFHPMAQNFFEGHYTPIVRSHPSLFMNKDDVHEIHLAVKLSSLSGFTLFLM